MVKCLAVDWGHDSSLPLAELFRLSSLSKGDGSLLVCMTPRTFRLFPQLEGWAREEGFLVGLWLKSPNEEADRKSDWLLSSFEKAASLTFKGELQECEICTQPSELLTARRTVQGT